MTAEYTLREIAERLGGRIGRGDAETIIRGFATLASAGPGDISFAATDKLLGPAGRSQAGVIVVPEGVDIPERSTLIVPEIWDAVCKLIDIFRSMPPVAEPGIHPTAHLGEGAEIGEGAAIGANVVIGRNTKIGRNVVIGAGTTIGDETTIGDDCIIHPGVHISHLVQIGSRVILNSGAVLGGDGFKFEFIKGAWKKIPQVGTVVIEDDVEIGANSTVDRAFLDETRVCRGVKIDNLVQVAHNAHIGANSLLCAFVGISGSTRLGENCIFAGRVGVRDNVTIGNGVQAAAASGIKDSIPDGEVVMGTPAMPMGEWSRMYAASRKGPEMLKRLRALEIKVEKLTE